MGRDPVAAAITPDGRFVYVVSFGTGTITPIRVSTGRADKATKVGEHPEAIVVTS